jgi:Hypoxia induced protein conserved region
MRDTQYEEPVILSETEARAGVTGHHVRHVLAFGLAGSIAAFLAIAVYFGHDRLAQAITELGARMESGMFATYALLLALAVVVIVLLLGLWDMVAGRSLDTSERVMRWRVVLQFTAICLAMAMLYLSATQV